MNNQFCAQCGKPMEEGATFCGKCGAKQETKVFCPKCGTEVENDATFCPKCGHQLEGSNTNTQAPEVHYPPQEIMNQREIIIQQAPPQSNGAGTAGFVFCLLSILLCWVPVLDVILLLLGIIFIAIGLGREPNGLAKAGCIIYLILIVISILILVICGAAAFSFLDSVF